MVPSVCGQCVPAPVHYPRLLPGPLRPRRGATNPRHRCCEAGGGSRPEAEGRGGADAWGCGWDLGGAVRARGPRTDAEGESGPGRWLMSPNNYRGSPRMAGSQANKIAGGVWGPQRLYPHPSSSVRPQLLSRPGLCLRWPLGCDTGPFGGTSFLFPPCAPIASSRGDQEGLPGTDSLALPPEQVSRVTGLTLCHN